MGARGPKAKPMSLLKLTNPAKARQRAAEAKRKQKRQPAVAPTTKWPRAARWMSKGAQKEYRKMAPMLWEMRLLTTANKDWWFLFCSMHADLKTIEQQIAALLEDGGPDLFGEKPKTDVMRLRRLMATRRELSREVMRALRQAGLAPEDVGLQPAEPESPRARFFSGKPKPGDNRGA